MNPMQLPDRMSALRTALYAVVVAVPCAQAQTYRVTDLGVIPGQTISHPGGINQSGQVTGYSGSHAARFTYGVVEDLGTLPGGNISTGIAIDDLGQVVGDSQHQNGGSIRHATLFSNGTRTDLGYLPSSGNYSRGMGINNATEVVGWSGPSMDTTNTRAFIWDATNGMRDLSTLGGQYARAHSINDAGAVTGNSQIGSGFGSLHAFLWTAAGGIQDLGTLAGTTSTGNFINANGHVVGKSTIGNDNRHHAFLWDGTMHDLGAIGDNDFLSDRSEAFRVNIHDHVVGTTYRPYTGGALSQIAFVHRGGQMLDLETLLDASSTDWRLYVATGINDAGQIAVYARRISTNQLRAVLLTPNETMPFCLGDGSGTACPCGNDAPAGSGAGCLNSLGTGGRLASTGTPSIAADTLVLHGSGMPDSTVLYFQGTTQLNGGAGSVFGDGLRCAGGSVIRLGAKVNVAGASQYPAAGDPSISVRGANAAGDVRTYQGWYRNAAAFCQSATFNLTNGLQATWAP